MAAEGHQRVYESAVWLAAQIQARDQGGNPWDRIRAYEMGGFVYDPFWKMWYKIGSSPWKSERPSWDQREDEVGEN